MANRGLNLVQIIGNLGQDPEEKFSANGDSIANISIATSEVWNDKNSGEAKSKTEWHRISAFGKLAEVMCKHLQKGSKVYISGKLETRKWTDKNGTDHYATSIRANEMQFLDSKGSNNSGGGNSGGFPEKQQAEQKPVEQPEPFDDSDIPF